MIDVSWHCAETLEKLNALKGNFSTKTGKLQRDHLKLYLNGVGAVPWQRKQAGLPELDVTGYDPNIRNTV